MNTDQFRQANANSSSPSMPTMSHVSQHECTNGCFHQQDKDNLSRRSIDWRDSGIVIDEDNHLFHPFENIRSFDSQSSLRSDYDRGHSSQQVQPRTFANNEQSKQNIALRHDEDGDTILHLAVVGLSLEKAKDLIGLCDLNAINNMMQTPLHVATLAERPEMVRLLLSSGAKLDVHDRRGNTPLHLACQKGLIEIVEIILDAIAMEQIKSGGPTREQAIKSCNFEGFTCLHLAAMNVQNKIIELLVSKYQADLSARDSKSGETILHKAIRHFNIDLVNFILKRSNQHSLINAADYSGRVPVDTLRVLLKESDMTNNHQDNNYSKLVMMKQLIEDGIGECVAQGGCCVGKNKRDSEPLNSSDTDSSSSDYSDSD